MPVQNLTPLFCKPNVFIDQSEILFSQHCKDIGGTISFRSLDLQNDLPDIYDWVNMDYTREYWQMNGHFSQLFAIYQCMELNPYSHSFIGLFNGNMICQFDVYSVIADELREHVRGETHDCGFHLLMAPNKSPVKGLTTAVINSFLNYYFSFTDARRMYAEPDVNNLKSIKLLKDCGFELVKRVQMSYKVADVYCKDKP